MPGRVLAAFCTAVMAFGASAAPGPAAEPAPGPAAAPAAGVVPAAGVAPARVSRLLTQLQGLFRKAAEAEEAYDVAQDLFVAQTVETGRLNTALADARDALARSRVEAGLLARRQYQGRTELPPYLGLLLARDPRRALDQGYLLERAAGSRRAAINRLERRALRVDALATASRKALDQQQSLAEEERGRRDTARARLKDVEAMLASLSARELAALGAPAPPTRTNGP